MKMLAGMPKVFPETYEPKRRLTLGHIETRTQVSPSVTARSGTEVFEGDAVGDDVVGDVVDELVGGIGAGPQ